MDDTDEDPDYDPSHLDHLSSEDEQPLTSTGRPRGRPPTFRPGTSVQNRPTPFCRPRQARSTIVDDNIYKRPIATAICEEDAQAGWEMFSEHNDPGNTEQHQFLEQPGPKHCPPHNSKPIDYFYLFFT